MTHPINYQVMPGLKYRMRAKDLKWGDVFRKPNITPLCKCVKVTEGVIYYRRLYGSKLMGEKEKMGAGSNEWIEVVPDGNG